MQKEKHLSILNPNTSPAEMRSKIENACRLGTPVLIENIGTRFEPSLENVIYKNYSKSGNNCQVLIGDKYIDVLDEFILYMTCKVSNLVYSPE